MVKLTKQHGSGPHLVIRVEGKLDTDSLQDLRGLLGPSPVHAAVTLDLAGLASLDPAGSAFLAQLQRAGCQLRGGSMYINQLLEEVPPMTQVAPATLDAVDHEPGINDEARLLERLRSGEDAAFEELVRLTSGRLLAVARRMLRREEDAQDAVQDAFLNAFKSLDSFDARSRLTTWLHRITVNTCLMKLRSQRRRPERTIDTLLPEFIEDGHQRTPSKPWNPIDESGIEAAELRALVRSKIDELPDNYREILMLRDIEELDTQSTASYLGMSEPAVKTRLHRARQALRTLLDPHLTEQL